MAQWRQAKLSIFHVIALNVPTAGGLYRLPPVRASLPRNLQQPALRLFPTTSIPTSSLRKCAFLTVTHVRDLRVLSIPATQRQSTRSQALRCALLSSVLPSAVCAVRIPFMGTLDVLPRTRTSVSSCSSLPAMSPPAVLNPRTAIARRF
jgi:hypothetical protein